VTNDPRYPIGKFPENVDANARETLIREIAAAPDRLREAVAGFTEEQLESPYRPGGWTVRQVVHHLPDSHMNSYVRFKLAVTDHEPTIVAYDESRWAELADARSASIEASLQLLSSLHERWVMFLRSLEPEQFERKFRHPELGTVTLGQNVALYAWHGKHHSAHITALREREGWT
jgi:uncharacterized damage-inducible protein DinB